MVKQQLRLVCYEITFKNKEDLKPLVQEKSKPLDIRQKISLVKKYVTTPDLDKIAEPLSGASSPLSHRNITGLRRNRKGSSALFNID